jgi:hypothetical protein
MKNPKHSPNAELGHSMAQWAALRQKVEEYLAAHAAEPTVDEASVRAVAPALSDQRTWNAIKAALNLT